jgi:hypothetical protein
MSGIGICPPWTQGRSARPPTAAGGWWLVAKAPCSTSMGGGLPVLRAGGWGCGLRFGGLGPQSSKLKAAKV